MANITKTTGQYPAALQGTIVFTGTPSGTFAKGEAVTGTGFSGKVVAWNATDKKLTVKAVAGTPTGTITGGTSGATGTVATVNTTAVGGLDVKTGGWNLRETSHGITRTKAVGSRGYIAEVLFASAGLAAARTDVASVPTFTLTGGAWGGDTAGTYDRGNGDKITLTIISNEAVKFNNTVTFPITVGGVARSVRFSSSSNDGLTHTFSYTPVAGDDGAALTIATVAGDFTVSGNGKILDVVGGTDIALSGTVSVGGTIADKTAVTIQA